MEVEASGTPAVEGNLDTTEGAGAAESPADLEPWRKVKHKYKAAGEEVEVDYDELIRRASKADGSEKRLAHAAKIEKEAKARFDKLKDPSAEDFDELVEMLGFQKATKFAEDLLWKKIQWEELPAEEKRARLAEERAEKLERDLRAREEREQEGQKTRQQEMAFQVIDKEIESVLEEARKQGLSTADIPEIKEMIVDEMLSYLEYVEELEAKGQPVRHSPPSHADVMRKIQERHEVSSSAFLKRLSADQLASMLTKEQLSALRKKEIDQLYAPIPSKGRSQSQSTNSEKPRQQKPQKVMKTEDYFKNMDEKFGV